MTNFISIEDRLCEFGDVVRIRLKKLFFRSKLSYPPESINIVVFKDTNILELYAEKSFNSMSYIKSYEVTAASGTFGPKLMEGDKQVPEGIYQIVSFNPNSNYHLSLRLNYPNEFDKAIACKDKRTNLGGDIMIHGGTRSVGCIAVGDRAIEELFVLAFDVGIEKIKVIICPTDFRQAQIPPSLHIEHEWINELYKQLEKIVLDLPSPESRILDTN